MIGRIGIRIGRRIVGVRLNVRRWEVEISIP